MRIVFNSQLLINLFSSTSAGGSLIFIDTAEMSIMGKQEHPDISDVEWDPTGRYVASSVNLWNAKVNEDIGISVRLVFFFSYLISVIIHLKSGRFKAFCHLKKMSKDWSHSIGVHDHHHC
jgi:hypothetical protein